MRLQASAMIPTLWGNFNMMAYADTPDEAMPHLAMVHEDFDASSPVLLRIHSECVTGDIFGSHRCDCGEQLHEAMRLTAASGGAVIYLRQEGRGIGLINKLKAYQLQDKGLNTADANIELGFAVDSRDYGDAMTIIQDLGIKQIRLLTNNPLKLEAFKNTGIEVVSREALVIQPNSDNDFYLHTKQDLMGHFLGL